MEIKYLKQPPEIEADIKLKKAFNSFHKLLVEIRKKDVPDDIINIINQVIDEYNERELSPKERLKTMKKQQGSVLKLLEKELKLVPKNYYLTIWLSVGLAAFGIPLGTIFGFALGRMAYLGIGLPIGMVLGMALGNAMDQKALKEGRQLAVEMY